MKKYKSWNIEHLNTFEICEENLLRPTKIIFIFCDYYIMLFLPHKEVIDLNTAIAK